MTPEVHQGRVTEVSLVTAAGCHFCDDAGAALRDLIDAGVPLRLTTVTADSPQGRELIRRHRPAMNPLVLVDGNYFSAGRLPRRKLDALLNRGASGRLQVIGRG